MKKTKSILVLGILICSVSIMLSCNIRYGNYDPALQTPDGYGHGYNLTELGCLLYAPWEINNRGFSPARNISYEKSGDYLPHKSDSLSEQEKNLVFELHRNGTMKYWFKTDYIISSDDTVIQANGVKRFSHIVLPSSQLQLKKIYTQGTWGVNFKDSSIVINFGKNDFGLAIINAKYKDLGSDNMNLEEIAFVDNLYNGKMLRLKKTTTTYFVH
jgi:hypothetical protein